MYSWTYLSYQLILNFWQNIKKAGSKTCEVSLSYISKCNSYNKFWKKNKQTYNKLYTNRKINQTRVGLAIYHLEKS